MFRKKSLSDELFLLFFIESSESDRVFNYLHDSNSIFRVGGIKSENVFGRTVLHAAFDFRLPTSLLHSRRPDLLPFWPVHPFVCFLYCT